MFRTIVLIHYDGRNTSQPQSTPSSTANSLPLPPQKTKTLPLLTFAAIDPSTHTHIKQRKWNKKRILVFIYWLLSYIHNIRERSCVSSSTTESANFKYCMFSIAGLLLLLRLACWFWPPGTMPWQWWIFSALVLRVVANARTCFLKYHVICYNYRCCHMGGIWIGQKRVNGNEFTFCF